MKSILYFFTICLLTSFGATAENITLSGKITNMTDEKLFISGVFFNREITLQPDGSFSDTFELPYSGTYNLKTLNNRVNLYLEKGTTLSIVANDTNFFETVIFSGKRAVENQYLAAKAKLAAVISIKDLYTLDENDFLKKTSEMNEDAVSNFEKTVFPTADFAEAEKRSLELQHQLMLKNYESYHSAIIKKKYSVSKNYPQVNIDIDKDNEADYLFSVPYREVTWEKFNEIGYGPNAIKELSGSKFPFTAANTYKSPIIRNVIMESFSDLLGTDGVDSEKLYADLMVNITDEKIKQQITEKYTAIKSLVPGKAAFSFDYQNYAGGRTTMENLKGKYVYIDVWATWCGPCREEIPALLKIEESYKGKNIAFVSISIDAKKDHEKWKKMIADKKLGGIQLIADGEWNAKIIKDYSINGIPRFILIGPDGNIIDPDAPRPSDSKLRSLFKDLKI